MGEKKRLTPGTVFMIALTLCVVVCCAVFFFAIMEGRLYAHPQELLERFPKRETPSPGPTAGEMPTTPEPGEEPGTPPPSAVPPEQQSVSLSIVAAGTIYAPKTVWQSAQRGDRVDFSDIFSGLDDMLSGADLSIATLEMTAASADKGYGGYNAPPEILDALRGSGIDLVNLATEHALDKGYEGLDLTLGELTARGLISAGVRDEKSGFPGAFLSVNGVQVAVLAYTYGLSDEGAGQTSDDSRGMLARLDEARMTEDIANARAQGAKLVILLPHWGTKNRRETPEALRLQARRLAEAGADIILGTHPNVVQGTERLSVVRADGLEYEAVVCYSLGCLLHDARISDNTAGMAARIGVTYDPVTRRTQLDALSCACVYIACQRENGQQVFRVVDVESAAQMDRLSPEQQEAAREAAQTVREVTGQSDWESEGEG